MRSSVTTIFERLSFLLGPMNFALALCGMNLTIIGRDEVVLDVCPIRCERSMSFKLKEIPRRLRAMPITILSVYSPDSAVPVILRQFLRETFSELFSFSANAVFLSTDSFTCHGHLSTLEISGFWVLT